jgi:hypothetical protein
LLETTGSVTAFWSVTLDNNVTKDHGPALSWFSLLKRFTKPGTLNIATASFFKTQVLRTNPISGISATLIF